MKIAKIILMSLVIALASTSLGMAAGSVQVNQSVYVSAEVKNTQDYDLQAAVKLLGYDNVGNAVGHVCREVTLPANDTITVTYRWRAPAYKTGLYWSSKVDIDGSCTNHDGDDSDSDSDSDGDSDDSDD
ncbi:MAG: hypothetical protein KKH60_03365 [Proteobacteria bacterium]|nr:hypothetical protein [Pseudomonadota bacterium]MBU1139376.1 hypothetical protein [Pseudomonadota bacterium]